MVFIFEALFATLLQWKMLAHIIECPIEHLSSLTYYKTSVSFLEAVLGYNLTEVTAMKSHVEDQTQIKPENLTRMVRCTIMFVVFF